MKRKRLSHGDVSPSIRPLRRLLVALVSAMTALVGIVVVDLVAGHCRHQPVPRHELGRAG